MIKYFPKTKKEGNKMLSIKDYLALRKIRDYIDNKRDEEIRENNGYANMPVAELDEMIKSLDKIILKLEREE